MVQKNILVYMSPLFIAGSSVEARSAVTVRDPQVSFPSSPSPSTTLFSAALAPSSDGSVASSAALPAMPSTSSNAAPTSSNAAPTSSNAAPTSSNAAPTSSSTAPSTSQSDSSRSLSQSELDDIMDAFIREIVCCYCLGFTIVKMFLAIQCEFLSYRMASTHK